MSKGKGETYVASKPCKRGHEPIRFVKGGMCVACSAYHNEKKRKKTIRLREHLRKEQAIIEEAKTVLPPTPKEQTEMDTEEVRILLGGSFGTL